MTVSQDRANSRDRILIVESDSTVSDLIGRQALQAVGYQVQVVADASSAIARALQWTPDVILADLNLPGLSGKDLLVALASQGVQTPLIVLAQRGMEADVIQTFRLGAADYILLPAREAEVVNAVNRVLKQVHDRREREQLAHQLQQANHELQSRVGELTTIFALGKALTSITEQASLLEKVVDGAMRVTQADLGWFLLREDTDKPFLVVAQRNLPPALGVRMNHPWDDGISSLVAMSGEALSIHGEPLKRFKISALGLSILIVPIRVQKKVIGLLVMMRRKPVPFTPSEQHLLDALADYASISLVNARQFRAAEERARSLQQVAESSQLSEKVKLEIIRLVKKELVAPLQSARASLENLSRDPLARWRTEQRQQLTTAQDQLGHALQVAQAIDPLSLPKGAVERAETNLVELTNEALRRLQPFAQRCGVLLSPEIPSDPLFISGDSSLLSQALDGIFSNAIKFSSTGGHVVICLARSPDNQAHLIVRNSGQALAPKDLEKVFEDKEPGPLAPAKLLGAAPRFGGLGVRLGLVKEIIRRHDGKVWLENKAARSIELHVLLPLAR